MLVFYLIATIGVLFHLLMKVRDAFTKSEKFDWKRQLFFSLYSLLTAYLLVFFRDGICEILSLTVDFNSSQGKLLIFFLAYFSDSVFKNLENTGRQTLKTNNDDERN